MDKPLMSYWHRADDTGEASLPSATTMFLVSSVFVIGMIWERGGFGLMYLIFRSLSALSDRDCECPLNIDLSGNTVRTSARYEHAELPTLIVGEAS